MDLYRLSSDIKYVNKLGETLNTREKIGLDIGLNNILKEEQLDQLLFWGRIRGLKKDYYIALGLKMADEYEFPAKRFYWR